jgi:hypothetical protein
MISGKSLKEIIAMLGRKGTKTKNIVQVLKTLGYEVPSRLQRLKVQPKFAIAKQPLIGTQNWHWVVIWNGKKYDPDGKKHLNYNNPLSSYLPIFNIED